MKGLFKYLRSNLKYLQQINLNLHKSKISFVYKNSIRRHNFILFKFIYLFLISFLLLKFNLILTNKTTRMGMKILI